MNEPDTTQFLLAEYSTLREEVFRAQDYAQSNVRWTMTTYGALFSIGLLSISTSSGSFGDSLTSGVTAIANGGSTVEPTLLYVLLTLFGLVIPALVWIGTWMWLGELRRAERASSYLRGLEQQIAAGILGDERRGSEPLRWERFMMLHRGTGSVWGMRESASWAIGAMFLTSILIPLLVFGYLLAQQTENSAAKVAFVAGALVISGTGLWVTVPTYKGLMRVSQVAADVPPQPSVQLGDAVLRRRRPRRRAVASGRGSRA